MDISSQSASDNEKYPLMRDRGSVNGSMEVGGNNINTAYNHSDGDVYYDSFPSVGIHQSRGPPDYDDVQVQGQQDVGQVYVKPDVINAKVTTEIKTYKRRWYILIMFSLFSATQNAVWNTWGPISNSSERVFGWNDSTIAWLANWGPIAFIIIGFPYTWLLQVKGLRWSILSSSLLTSLGCSLRVITSNPPTATILIHIGQFLNGLAGPMAMGAVPFVSATWFPVHERVTATALTTSISVFGNALAFIVGPAVVSDIGTGQNNTQPTIAPGFDQGILQHNYTKSDIAKEEHEIMMYMYYSCGVTWLISLIILIYFPNRPPLPPCASAIVKRDNFWVGMWALRKKGYFIGTSLIYAISAGVVACWASVLNVNLRQLDVSEVTSGWIGFYGTVASCVCSLLVGRFADCFVRSMKLFILAMYLVGCGFFIVFDLMFIKVIPFSNALLYTTVIGGMTTIQAAIPLMFELACELAFPTSEASANGVLTYLNNVAGLIFLVVFNIPNIGDMWMNWAVLGSTAICLPLIALLNGRMKRLEIDEAAEPHGMPDQEVIVNSNGDVQTS